MSATADANQLSDYLFGCDVFHLSGRSFPVDVKYVPCGDSEASTSIAPYLQEVVKTCEEIHRSEKEGTILALLTSQEEVECAFEDQFRVFEDFPSREKKGYFCRISQSGRSAPGVCYRLYTEYDYKSMPLNQEPEIHRVHLGIAVLRILALGIKNISEFDFIDAPSSEAIEMGIRRNLVLLGKEGLVLANARSIFCRVGSRDDKNKADCFKVQFCHHSADLFTLLSVFKEWEALPPDQRYKWCWGNSINA
ncbi:unnamed protein product [Linum tenue]|uniref:RNA helicase n=1 Tax=Linum tenue TaxID=586396 RepID=A0AAV0NQP6_9ROSI|nr:unnamed protein product [Linum tenue]